MPLAEIACFRIDRRDIGERSKPFLAEAPYDQPTATLRFHISHGIRALTKSSKHQFYLLQEVKDPFVVYYVGRWPTLEVYHAFSTSKERNDLVEALKQSRATMEWKGLYEVLHYDAWEGSVLLALTHKHKGLRDAKFVGISRHTVDPVEDNDFERKLRENRPLLEKYSGHKTAAGRQIHDASALDGVSSTEDSKKDPAREEYVVLSGWTSEEQYDKFPETEEFRQYAQIRSETKWFERGVTQPVHLE